MGGVFAENRQTRGWSRRRDHNTWRTQTPGSSGDPNPGQLQIPLSRTCTRALLARLLAAETKHAILQERKHWAVKIALDCFSLSNSNRSRMRLLLSNPLLPPPPVWVRLRPEAPTGTRLRVPALQAEPRLKECKRRRLLSKHSPPDQSGKRRLTPL